MRAKQFRWVMRHQRAPVGISPRKRHLARRPGGN
jgi:hypothetical protein